VLTIEQLLPYLGQAAPPLLPGTIATLDFRRSMEHHLIEATRESQRLNNRELAAIYLMCGYGDGSLLSSLAVRRITNPWPDSLTIDISRAGVSALADTMLGRHAHGAIALAAALGYGNGMTDLNTVLGSFDGWNRWITWRAMGIALEQRPMAVPSVLRAAREQRIRAEWEAHGKMQDGTATDADLETFIKALAGQGRDDD
jgi:hypothetical protein